MDEILELSDEQAWAFLEKVFPHGFAGSDVLSELAPEGWDQSPLVRAFHPTFEQWHEERIVWLKNFNDFKHRFSRHGKNTDSLEGDLAMPELQESRKEFEETPVDAKTECRQIVGAVTWEIFSDNHSVVADDGREVHLGSWRGASAFLDEFDRRNRPIAHTAPDDLWSRIDGGDCMRFYMGLLWLHGRCDYHKVYQLVFRRLHALGSDWIYHFPRIRLVNFDHAKASRDEAISYDPSAAFAAGQEQREKDEKIARMEANLETSYREAVEDALQKPPPPVVLAYQTIYHRLPDGWPPI